MLVTLVRLLKEVERASKIKRAISTPPHSAHLTPHAPFRINDTTLRLYRVVR